MRPSLVAVGKLLWVSLLVLSIPWTGPSIHPHLLEHEAEDNRARETLASHVHDGVHFEAVLDADASPDCHACLRSHAKGMARTMAPTDTVPDAPRIIERPLHDHIKAFRLAGRVAARAPPWFPLHSS